MNFSNKICLLCLENHDNLLEIYGKRGTDFNVGAILQEHFWFEVGTLATENICVNCWTKVESFHIFYNFVKSIHQQQTCEAKAIIDNGLAYSIKEEPIDIKEVFDVFTDYADTANSPASSGGWMEVDSDTMKGPATAAHKTQNSKAKMLTSSDTTDILAPRSDRLEIDSGTIGVPATVEHKTRKYKPRGSATPLINKADHTSLLSQYFNMACDLCDTLLSSYRDTKKHYRDFHDIKAGYLICCNRKYFSLQRMLSHCEWHRNPDAFKCDQCPKSFRDKFRLRGHLYAVHVPKTEKTFNCNDCSQTFSSVPDLRKHQRCRHSQSFQCPICQKCFTGKISLRHHIRDNHSLEEEREFRNKMRSLKKVDQVKEEAKKFECDVCGSRFAYLSSLRSHILRVHVRVNVHRDDRSRICEICAKPFSSEQSYKFHFINAHTNELKKVQCDICGKWLKHKYRIYKHMRWHNSKTATCKICGRVCSNEEAVQDHIRRVHREASLLECIACGKKFKAKKSLQEHMAMHAGITDLYTCTFCTKTFRSNGNLYSHRKRAHPAELEELKRIKRLKES